MCDTSLSGVPTALVRPSVHTVNLCDEKESISTSSSMILAMDAKLAHGDFVWSTLSSKYELMNEIARGSFGIVRLCHIRNPTLSSSSLATLSTASDSSLSLDSSIDINNNNNNNSEQQFAIKIIKKSKLHALQFKDVHREIKILAHIGYNGGHKNIVNCIETFETNKDFYIVTELLSGDTLEQRIDNTFNKFNNNTYMNNTTLNKSMNIDNNLNRFNEAMVAILFCQICLALDFLHNVNIVHRDLKPSNLIFTHKNGIILKLIDFGLSGILSHKNNYTLTRKCGTPFYVAPEIIDNRNKRITQYNTKVDMWAAGVILYILFSGHLPFILKKDESLTILYKQILDDKIKMDSYNWQFVPPDAKDLVLKLLERNPSKRLTAKQALEHSWVKSIFKDNLPGYQY